MENPSPVDILLSTFNGESYISEQLESLARQSYPAINLLIRDDGSSDGTTKILEEFQKQHGHRCILVKGENLGIVESFNFLLQQSESRYVFFCDQDDIWEAKKVETMVDALVTLEGEEITPSLVYSDMVCIDSTGQNTCGSYWKKHGINSQHNSLPRLLLQNVVTGTACGFNRALLEKAAPVPEQARLHDWWFALNAAAFGKITPIGQPLVRYRLHGENAVGANSIDFKRFLSVATKPAAISFRINNLIRDCTLQSKQFLAQNKYHLDNEQNRAVEQFSQITDLGFFKRRMVLLKHGIRFSATSRNILLMFFWR